MILDMNIRLSAIDETFLEELDELIEDTRVEYFIINPINSDELAQTQNLCEEYERFKYTVPVELQASRDDNCVALRISEESELSQVTQMPLVIESAHISDDLIDALNQSKHKGVVLSAKESDNRLENFAYAISHDSLKLWSKKGLTDTDYNRLALQSDYPNFSYDELLDGLLKDMSDLTFRAEQTIAAGGTRTVLKTFGLL